MTIENQIPSMCVAASIAPIMLKSFEGQGGNLYVEGKNTFLEFYTDENKAIKRSSQPRSASVNSYFKSSDVPDVSKQFSAPELGKQTNWASSPDFNILQSQSEVFAEEELQSPNATPRAKTHCYQNSRSGTYNVVDLMAALMPSDVKPSAKVQRTMSMSTCTNEKSPKEKSYSTGHRESSDQSTWSVTRSSSRTSIGSMADQIQSDSTPRAKTYQGHEVLSPGIRRRPSNNEFQSLDTTPRTNTYQYHDANYNVMVSSPTSNDDVTPRYPYPMMMMPLMIPYPMNESQQRKGKQPKVVKPQGVKPQVIKPRNQNWEIAQPQQPQMYATNCETACQVKPTKSEGRKKNLNKQTPTNETTVMIRGIPCSITQEVLMAFLDCAGLKGQYNFFYLPTDTNRNERVTNLGYAFVNFVNQQSADLCKASFEGVRLAPERSLKKCAISPADIQGLPSLKKHFCRTLVSRGTHGPMFLKV